METPFNEVLYYTGNEEDGYVGSLASVLGVISGKSVEELEKEAKITLKVWINMLTEALEHPLEMKLVTSKEFLK